MSILNFKISHKNKLIGISNYAILNSNSTSFTREIIFYNFEKKDIIKIEAGDTILIQLDYKNKFNSSIHITDFEIYLTEDEVTEDYVRLKGIIMPNEYHENYDQQVIDVFHSWQKGNDIIWQKLTTEEKEVYYYCCSCWSGLTKSLNYKNYVLNCELVNEEIDFFILLGEIFVGIRGYFGDYMYTLEDCLIEIYNNNQIINLEFKEHHILINIFGKPYFEKIVQLFKEYNFVVKLDN